MHIYTLQNDWPKTVGGVALTSQLLTNGQTDERTGHGTPISHLHANAGATKSRSLGLVYFFIFISITFYSVYSIRPNYLTMR